MWGESFFYRLVLLFLELIYRSILITFIDYFQRRFINETQQENEVCVVLESYEHFARLREVQLMSLHPYSRQQKLAQIQRLKASSVSKKKANAERDKLHV